MNHFSATFTYSNRSIITSTYYWTGNNWQTAASDVHAREDATMSWLYEGNITKLACCLFNNSLWVLTKNWPCQHYLWSQLLQPFKEQIITKKTLLGAVGYDKTVQIIIRSKELFRFITSLTRYSRISTNSTMCLDVKFPHYWLSLVLPGVSPRSGGRSSLFSLSVLQSLFQCEN